MVDLEILKMSVAIISYVRSFIIYLIINLDYKIPWRPILLVRICTIISKKNYKWICVYREEIGMARGSDLLVRMKRLLNKVGGW